MTITTIAKHVVNLFYPLQCPSCRTRLDPEAAAPVCAACAARIRRTLRPYCVSCGKTVNTEGDLCPECRRLPPRQFDRAYSACLYEGALKELIHSFKFGSKLPLEKFLAGLMIDFAREYNDIVNGIDLITFVPLHRNRLNARGFNQSKLLAREIAAAFGIEMADTLKKLSPGKHQNELSREERLVNLDDAFATLPRIPLRGKAVLIIDDVMTTGATLNECARTLKAAGATKVHCLTLARGA